MKAFEKEYGDDNFSFEDVKELKSEGSIFGKGIEGLSAALMNIEDEKAKAISSGNTQDLENLNEIEKDTIEQLESNLPILQDYRNNLTDLMDYRELTADEQAFYDNLEQGMKLIYQFTDQALGTK